MADLVSVVVPFYNEADSLTELVRRINASLQGLGCPFEIILVNDGSTDHGRAVAEELAGQDPRIRLIHFTRNFGKSAALSAGFQRAAGSVIVTMDADLQDDPVEIPRFLAKIEDGFDVVSGWKQTRHDPLSKRLPSKFFNALVRLVFGLRLNDINCGFKAYTKRAIANLPMYGELHRLTPALLQGAGFKVTEIPVRHHPRRHGKSKFGSTRFIKGLLDLMTVVMLTRYQTRPLHLFGFVGFGLGAAGVLILFYLTILWLAGLGPIGTRPLFFLGILLVLTAVQLVGIGLIAELFRSSQLSERAKYVIDATRGFEDTPIAKAS